MKLVVAAGGTGGHVYPALTVITALRKPKAQGAALPAMSRSDLLWIGSRGGMEEELVGRADLDFVGLAAGGLRGMGPLVRIRNAGRIIGSVARVRRLLGQFEPDVVFITGAYASVAVALAARTLRVPVLIYLPDIVPGQAIRLLSHFAARVAVTSEESYHYFRREKVVVTGYPVRPEVYELDRTAARRIMGLDVDAKTLLVLGGSQGARSINQALVAGLGDLLPICQIVHISGRLDADWVAEAANRLPAPLRERYHYHAYLHEMPPALVAADLAVARAGAATLGEFPAAQLPSVLVPYPYSGQHQRPNALYMERNGAAVLLPDADLKENLVPTVLRLLGDEQALAGMRESAHAMARPDAADVIAEQVWRLARQRAGHPSAPAERPEEKRVRP